MLEPLPMGISNGPNVTGNFPVWTGFFLGKNPANSRGKYCKLTGRSPTPSPAAAEEMWAAALANDNGRCYNSATPPWASPASATGPKQLQLLRLPPATIGLVPAPTSLQGGVVDSGAVWTKATPS